MEVAGFSPIVQETDASKSGLCSDLVERVEKSKRVHSSLDHTETSTPSGKRLVDPILHTLARSIACRGMPTFSNLPVPMTCGAELLDIGFSLTTEVVPISSLSAVSWLALLSLEAPLH